MRTAAVVFDLDGTLIDSASDLRYATDRMLEELGGLPLSLDEFRSVFGHGVEVLVKRALAVRPGAVQDTAAALRCFLGYYEAHLTTSTKPYPGAVTALRALQGRGLKLAVCSNKPVRLTRTLLERLELAQYFTCVFGGDSLPFRKPDPRVIAEALASLGALTHESVLVGDSEVDAETATAAGLPFVLMTHGYARGPVGEIPCAAALEHFDQLLDFLGHPA